MIEGEEIAAVTGAREIPKWIVQAIIFTLVGFAIHRIIVRSRK